MSVPRLWFLPSYTLRGMMVAVAIAGALSAAAAFAIRRAALLRQAEFHRAEAQRDAESMERSLRPVGGIPMHANPKKLRRPRYEWRGGASLTLVDPTTEPAYLRAEASSKHHTLMQDRHRRAARRPRLPVAPDPHEPR